MMDTLTTDHALYATPLKDDVRAHLKTLCERHSAQSFLEIGTGFGETSAWLALKRPSMKIDTVEKNADAAQKAFQLFASLGLSSQIHVYHENAHRFYPVKTYDGILLDASKSQQQALVERFYPVLNPMGFMLIDNIHLSRIKNAPHSASRESLEAKHDAFMTWLLADPKWHVETLALGDGIAIITPVSKPFA